MWERKYSNNLEKKNFFSRTENFFFSWFYLTRLSWNPSYTSRALSNAPIDLLDSSSLFFPFNFKQIALTMSKSSSNTNKDSTVCVIDLMGRPCLVHRVLQQQLNRHRRYLEMSHEVDNWIVAAPIRCTTF